MRITYDFFQSHEASGRVPVANLPSFFLKERGPAARLLSSAPMKEVQA